MSPSGSAALLTRKNFGGSCSADFGLQVDTLPIRDHHLGMCGGREPAHTAPLHCLPKNEALSYLQSFTAGTMADLLSDVLFSDNRFESIATPQAKQALRMCLEVQLLTGDVA